MENKNLSELKKLEEIEKYLEIDKNEIKAKRRAVVILNKSEYKDEIEEYSDYYKVPGIIQIYFPDDKKVLNLPFMFDINLYKPNSIDETKSEIILEYQPGETIIKQKLKSSSTNFNTFRRILDGNAKFIKTPEQMVLSLAELMGYPIDLVHFEVMVQQVFRCKKDISKPCRLCDYKKCKLIGVSQLPRKISWLLGMSFERGNIAVRDALIEKIPLKETPFEKIILYY